MVVTPGGGGINEGGALEADVGGAGDAGADKSAVGGGLEVDSAYKRLVFDLAFARIVPY